MLQPLRAEDPPPLFDKERRVFAQKSFATVDMVNGGFNNYFM